ncbi:MAG: gliding motility-associated C-terminal domain-containing protein [Bacteroidetes bacterium]|nr:gliding motility-associated C-terminal domain-containing protein [Bacteroidota bacterium]
MKRLLSFSLLFFVNTIVFGQTVYPSGTTGCIARWDFANPGTFTSLPDVSGNGNNGTTTNVSTSSGFRNLSDKAGAFNGTSSLASVPTSSLLSPSAITIVALVKPTGFYAGNCQDNNIIYKSHNYYATSCWAMRIADNDGNCSALSTSTETLDFSGPGLNTGTFTGPIISTNKWYFLATTYDGVNAKRYTVSMDTNNYIGSFTSASTTYIGSPLTSNTYNVTIGATINPPFPFWYNGAMDEIVLFNRVLTDAELQSVYHYLWGDLFVSTNDTVTCSGTINVNYTPYNPDHFLPGNAFTVELSNASGSFASPTVIGSVTSTTAGSIACTIPPSVPYGTGYRVRVKSSDRRFTSADNGINIVYGPSTIGFSLGNDTTICNGVTLTLKSTKPIAGGNYTWSNGSTSSSIDVNTAGTYWASVGTGSCFASDTIQVSTRPVPTVFIGNDTTICNGETLTMNAYVQPAGIPLKWNNGSTANTITATTTGTYWLIADNYGCSATDSLHLLVAGPPVINLGNDTSICNGLVLRLPQSISSDLTYGLTWNDGSTNNYMDISHEGTYYATISNLCGTMSDTISVKFRSCHFWFPSAFSPNGDGKNDWAHLVGDMEAVSDFSLSIYDRWGIRVFQTTDKHTGWDGNYKGKEQPFGSYFYMVRFKFLGHDEFLKGDITLLR